MEQLFESSLNRVRVGFREAAGKLEGERLKLWCDCEAKAAEIVEGKREIDFLNLKIKEKSLEVSDRDKRIEELLLLLKKKKSDDDVILREERLKGMIGKCEEEIRVKKGRVSLIQKSMIECSKTLEGREERIRECNLGFGLIRKEMEEWCVKIEVKKMGLEECVGRIERRGEEVEAKIGELAVVEKRVKGWIDEAELKVGWLESLEKLMEEERGELEEVRKAVEERGKVVERKERELEVQAKEVEFRERQVELRNEEVELKDKRINERVDDVDLKDELLDSLGKSIQKEKEKLELLQTVAADREKQLDSIQKSVQEREKVLDSRCNGVQKREREVEKQAKEVELKQKQFDSLQKSVQEREKVLDSRCNGVQRREREVEKQAKEVALKQKQFDSLQKLVQEREKVLDSRCYGVQRREREVEKQIKELAMKQKLFDSHRKAKNAILDSSTSDQSWINMDGRSLQFVMVEQLEKIDLAGSQMSAVLQSASDPAKLVLDAMQGFYPSNVDVENTEFETHLRVVRKSCIILLQELKRMSPVISAQVREGAVRLAAEWKEKKAVNADNGWEALGLLRLIITYELTGVCDLRELRRLLSMVSQPDQAAEISRALGITDKEPGTNLVSSIVKAERLQSSRARNEAALSSSNNVEAPEACLSGNAATLSSPTNDVQNKRLATLKSSPDPAKLVLDLIQGSLTEFWRNGSVISKERVVLKNIALLKILMGLSTHVGPRLKENASNLASQWKEKLRAATEDSSESLGYLLLTAMYGLHATIHEDEIVMLLRRVSQHKLSLELCETQGFADYILDFIRKLIEKKLLMEAVRSICALKLCDKLPPVPLLNEYVEDLLQCSELICRSQMVATEKVKAVNGKIGDLIVVIQCIKDYNLESVFPSKTVEMQIVQLETLKEKWRSSAPSLVPKVEQETKKRHKPCTNSPAPKSPPEKKPKIRFVFKGSTS